MTDIKNIDGDVIYISASPDDTVKQALEQAVKAGDDLRVAYLAIENWSRGLTPEDLEFYYEVNTRIRRGQEFLLCMESGETVKLCTLKADEVVTPERISAAMAEQGHPMAIAVGDWMFAKETKEPTDD